MTDKLAQLAVLFDQLRMTEARITELIEGRPGKTVTVTERKKRESASSRMEETKKFILSNAGMEISTQQMADKIGHPFYEVSGRLKFLVKTGEVTRIRAGFYKLEPSSCPTTELPTSKPVTAAHLNGNGNGHKRPGSESREKLDARLVQLLATTNMPMRRLELRNALKVKHEVLLASLRRLIKSGLIVEGTTTIEGSDKRRLTRRVFSRPAAEVPAV